MAVDGERDLREIYAASAGRLVAVVYGLTGDYAEAEDAVHEAFARALVRKGQLRAVASPEAWLRTVAVNVARSRFRRRMILDRLVRTGRLARAEATVPVSPDRVAVVEALQRLPRPVRECLVLHYFADLPVAEVARAQDCTVATVKTRLHRGRRALAAALGEREDSRA
ncbi:sigma-70 family RNA polymerase sigma factor [Asanoa siamensis]|uniref:RNA polymerase sigma24 factor n=1 Tax=Asanoa siamensis TaxID=926357 RepID=A0ABQ4CJP6_9ACTN|nr:sigma-70 family RNA polymerase sigma factor [Asanoa siamensis]GIF71517.1 RNA polymerase sigma24 factor [Asanoa siamensis]